MNLLLVLTAITFIPYILGNSTSTATITSSATSSPSHSDVSTSPLDKISTKIFSSTILSICPENQIEDESGMCKCKPGFHSKNGTTTLICEEDKKSDKGSGSKLGVGAIAGIAAVSVLGVVVIVIALYCICKKCCCGLDQLGSS